VLARAGLPRLTLYQLRHTGATLLLRLGAPLEQVKEIMGHSRVEMTLGYVDAAEDLQRDALGRLDAFLREG
jgi:integrase